MAFSYDLSNGDGVARSWVLSFPYITSTHVKVTIDGVLVASSTVGSTVTLDGAVATPTADNVVKRYRDTPLTSLVSWAAGTLNDSETNRIANLQVLYALQERDDRVADLEEFELKSVRTDDTDLSFLPLAATRADKVIGFDEDGDIELYPNTLFGLRTEDAEIPAIPNAAMRAGKVLSFNDDGSAPAVVSLVDGQLSDALAVTYNPTWTGSAERTVRGRLADTVSLDDFGVVYDSEADAAANTTKLGAFLQACGGRRGYAKPGLLWINPSSVTVTGDAVVDCRGLVLKNAEGDAATTWLLTVIGGDEDKLDWRGGYFDCNESPHGGVFFQWGYPVTHIDGGTGIVCLDGVSHATTSLIRVGGKTIDGVAGWDHVHDLDGSGAPTLGSVPRVCSVDSLVTESRHTINQGRSTNTHTVLVIGDTGGGEWVSLGGRARVSADNLVYDVGNSVRGLVRFLDSDVSEELVVAASTTSSIDVEFCTFRRAANSMGMQNCPRLRLYMCLLEMNNAVPPVKTRVANTASGMFQAFHCHFRCRPSARVVDFGTNGTLADFFDYNNVWEIQIDPAIQTSQTLLAISPAARCRVHSKGSLWIISDAPGASPVTTATQSLIMPTVTEQSWWHSELINLCTSSSSGIRLAGNAQTLFAYSGGYQVSNVISMFEANHLDLTRAAPKHYWGNAAPTVGTHNRRDIVWNDAPAASGTIGWVCVTAGTPGTWKTFGPITA